MSGQRTGEDDALATRFRAYRSSGDRALRDELVRSQMGLATAVARRFARRGEPLDDLIQVANYGLVRAVERFDPEHGAPFAGFAVPTIMGEIKRHFRDHTWSGKVPRGTKELATRVNGAVEGLTGDLGRAPTVPEIAERLSVSVDAVVEALDAQQLYRPGSLSPVGSERAGDHPGLAVTDHGLSLVEDKLTVERLLRTLPERERRILELRFYDELTQSEIAEVVGVSQMHVSRLIRHALAQLAVRVDPAGRRGTGARAATGRSA